MLFEGLKRSAIGGLCVLAFVGQVAAADLIDVPTASYCRLATTSDLALNENIGMVKTEVVRMMDEAVTAANSSQWLESSRPVFVWASEAKVACGKAYGYLKTNYRDEDYLNKCECFHSRMVEYMN
jgi:isopropylmalate/homocitrate/citramalate synthase